MDGDSVELVQGTLDMLILKALASEPEGLHGYGVARWIEERTDEALRVEEGSLYPALHRMERKGWLTSRWGRSENRRRARFYGLTEAGRERLEREAGAWSAFVRVVARVMESG